MPRTYMCGGADLGNEETPSRSAGWAVCLPREPRQRDHEVLFRVRLVALEAGLVVRLVVELLIRPERGIFPLAVADVVGILRPPARALFHDRDADDIALDEPPGRVLHGAAGGIDLGLVLHEREDRPARDRLALAGRLHALRRAVELAVLLVVIAVDGGVEPVVLVVRREPDLLGPAPAR